MFKFIGLNKRQINLLFDNMDEYSTYKVLAKLMFNKKPSYWEVKEAKKSYILQYQRWGILSKMPHEKIGLHNVKELKLAFENWKKTYHIKGR